LRLLRTSCYPLLALLHGFFLFSLAAAAQTTAPGEWTWVGGSSLANTAEVWGTLGIPATANAPGNRDGAIVWNDKNGNLWLFGGLNFDANSHLSFLNDLWEFNLSTNEWVWVGGSNTAQCYVNGVCAQPGIYGTLGTPSSGNTPGGRESASSWTDSSGHLWLFGGLGVDADGTYGVLNDLWRFDPSSSTWTWVSGSNTVPTDYGQLGVYGTKGMPASGNTPGGRMLATNWVDSGNHLWLFGGDGYYALGIPGTFNDLWEFDPSSNEWTWVSGSATSSECDTTGSCSQSGVYGSMGTPTAANAPASRNSALSWIDNNGNFWLFGGAVPGVHLSYLNDVWMFNPASSEWTWMGGSSTTNQPGVYGTLGTHVAGSIPGSRCCLAGWTDNGGNLWLFGGQGYDIKGQQGVLNDLWKLAPSTNQWTWMGGNRVMNCITYGANYCGQAGDYGTLGVPAASNIPGSRMDLTSWGESGGNFWLLGGSGFDRNGSDSNLTDLWEYQPSATTSIPTAASPIFTPAANTYISPQSVTISDTTPGAAIFYTTDGVTTPTINSTLYTGAINVSAQETIQAIAVTANYFDSAVVSAAYNITPPAATPTFSVAPGTYTTAQPVTINDATSGATIYYTTNGTTPTTASTVYNGPITIAVTETVEAIAIASEYSSSAVASAAYVITPGFTIAGTAVSVEPGAITSNTSTITMTPVGGFTGSVLLTAVLTSSPANAVAQPSLSFGSTTPVSIATAAGGNATLTISTTLGGTLPCTASDRPGSGLPWAAGSGTALACVLLLALPERRRRWRSLLGMALLLAALGGSVTACGGGNKSIACPTAVTASTTPGIYTITVTGASGTTTETGTVTLTVQ